MAEGKKMALVPLDMLQQWKNHPNLTALKNPNQNQLVKTMNQMETILNDNSLPENIKSNRVSETLKDYSVYADKILQPHVEKPEVTNFLKQTNTKIFDSLPKTFQNSAKHLMNELEKHPETISWNPQNNEVSINGKC
jgi:glutaredoxin 2